MLRSVKSTNNSYTADFFTDYKIKLINLFLNFIKEREDFFCNKKCDNSYYGKNNKKNKGKARVHNNCHNCSADKHNRNGNNCAKAHKNEILHLTDVVNGSCYKRWDTYFINITLRKGFNLVENICSQLACKAC